MYICRLIHFYHHLRWYAKRKNLDAIQLQWIISIMGNSLSYVDLIVKSLFIVVKVFNENFLLTIMNLSGSNIKIISRTVN